MRPQLAFLVLPFMAACASNPPPPPPRPAPPPLVAPTPAPAANNQAPAGLDGRWAGDARLQPDQGRECRPPRVPVAMTVNQGRASLAFGRGQSLEGSITPDGMVNFSNGDVQAQGSFQGRMLQGEVVRAGCSYRINLRQRGR